MAKLDIEKFVDSILSMRFDEKDKEMIKRWLFSRNPYTPLKIMQLVFYKAIREQGLTYDRDRGFVEIDKETEWYVATDDFGSYQNNILGQRPLFLKGEKTTKEKIYYLCPKITDEEFRKYFVPFLNTDKDKLRSEVKEIFDRFNILDSCSTIGGLRDDVLKAINNSES